MVRAKFRCSQITKYDSGNGTDMTAVRLSAVSGKTNASWSKWTPSGTLEMTITNPEALERFALGQTYFLDFTPAPATEAEEK